MSIQINVSNVTFIIDTDDENEAISEVELTLGNMAWDYGSIEVA